ncbi:MAG: VTT domain-containing protein [Tessaracoccus sp.]|uniref:DedA family protein n=1 Tax=Tessaracoccus sp. TaxID=1971211 RepID=UPI001ED2C8F1|nr:VTT domain-containing protein [Tessaracoccus sp.]MBK7820501.1 VTT domain-containing protein [Tessaracoccus sp.]
MNALLLVLLMPNWMNPEYIIHWLGNWALWGCAFIIFAECGLFAILPGDSLLFTIGMFVALGSIDLTGDPVSTLILTCIILTIAAIAGNAVGYWLGRLIGPPIFKPRDGFIGKLFDPKYVARTHDFMEHYGSRALILARFVPIVRTFVTLVAGVAKMSFRTFMIYTAIGGVLWATGITVLGYFLGTVPFIHDNLEVALILIVAVSLIPMGVEYLLHKRRRAAAPAAEATE